MTKMRVISKDKAHAGTCINKRNITNPNVILYEIPKVAGKNGNKEVITVIAVELTSLHKNVVSVGNKVVFANRSEVVHKC